MLHKGFWTLVAALFAPPAGADTLLLNDGERNFITRVLGDPGGALQPVRVQNQGCDIEVADPCSAPGDATVLRILPAGGAGLVSVYESSEVWHQGFADDFRVYDDSSLLMDEGRTASIRAHDRSRVDLIDAFVGGDGGVRAQDDSVVSIGGDSVVLQFVRAEQRSRVTIDSNYLAFGIQAEDAARVEVRGAEIRFTETELLVSDEAAVTLFGSGFQVDGEPVPMGPLAALSGVLAGTFESGDAFAALNFERRHATSQIILAPEPGSGFLVAAGLLWLGRRRAERGRRRS